MNLEESQLLWDSGVDVFNNLPTSPETPYPAPIPPPPGSDPATIICYLKALFIYIGDLMNCSVINDPTDRAACIASSYTIYQNNIAQCGIA